MFNTIRKKLIMGFSIILVVIIISTIYNLYIYNDSKTHIMHIREKTIASFKYASQMKNNIVQVSQYLTDVSASKNTAHLKETEEYYVLYKKNSEEFASLNPEYKSELEQLNIQIDKLYSYGKEMADIYIKNGHEEGNKMMAEFDEMVDSIYIKLDEIQKKTETSMDKDLMTIQMHMSMNQNTGIALAAIIIIIALLIAIMLAGSITKPINNFLEIFKDLEKGQGDLTRRINVKSKDELAKMAQSFNNFMDSMENMVLYIKKNSSAVLQGSEQLNDGGIKTTRGISMINAHMDRVAEDTQKINASINDVTANISEIAQASQASAADARQVSLEADNINKLAQASGKLTLDIKLEMEKTEEISSNTIRIAEKLGHEAGEIGEIIDTIKSITDQTNLLALNAAIEAARAGEHGKGFGVVAEEIRKLAESNNQSAKTIENIIKNIQDLVHNTRQATIDVGGNIRQGNKMVESMYAQLQHIIEGVSNINERIQSIAASIEEQSMSNEKLSAAMKAINGSNTAITAATQEVAASISTQTDIIEGLSTTASFLNESAEQLNGLVSEFKLQ
ncbi:methyl-accepting chemotaxis protein [Petroclostridium sp. X23]|uniref:methyl-accepting chemotaxis protein n=1 Tax=Petroclostridium sp. X23 TaxID=3045146 RepID=UPI0024AD5216|nr:methyl-accepting chemotaxis protein [Petroclostridium sp. X23]WHH59984.1 methyl-accepting chemotaxis protein [Petroclostridium sp. X23]